MKKQILVLVLFMVFMHSAVCQSSVPGYLYPGQHYENIGQDTIFLLKYADFRKTLIKLNEAEVNVLRVNLLKQKIQALEDKSFLCDSVGQLRKLEAEFWRKELDKNDRALEEKTKVNVELRYENDRIRRSRLYYLTGGLIAGILATSLLVISAD